MQNLAVTYLINNYRVFDADFWLGYKVLEKLYPNFDDIKMLLLKSKRIDPKYSDCVANFEIEKQLLQAEWKAKSDKAKEDGTKTHQFIQNLLTTNPVECSREFQTPCDVDIQQQLVGVNNGVFVEYRLEVPMDDDYTLVGVPDYFYIHDGVIDIKDWKTSETAIKFKSMYEVSKHTSKKLKYPLCLDDAAGIHYQIQLSIYMWMLLKLRPDLKPGTMEIVWIKDNRVKKVYPVEYLEEKIDKFLKWHIKALHLDKEMAKCKEIVYGLD